MNYRASLEAHTYQIRCAALCGPTGTGKTRLLHALKRSGEQVIDLEELAGHRGSLIGAVPGHKQPTQKLFDSRLLETMRRLDPLRPVWIEAENKKIGGLQLPLCLYQAMLTAVPVTMTAPMAERVKLWREDYPHFASDPRAMVRLLEPLKPLVGGQELALWQQLAAQGDVDTLFERVMSQHYDPCYSRSLNANFGATKAHTRIKIDLVGLSTKNLENAARWLIDWANDFWVSSVSAGSPVL